MVKKGRNIRAESAFGALPNGCKVYTAGYDASGNEILVDENGNKYTLEPTYNANHELMSLTVLDKNGNDVSADFKWLTELVKMTGGLSLG